MKIKFDLTYPGSFQWTRHQNHYFIGYIFDLSQKLYQKASDFQQEDFESNKIESYNGAFSSILILEDTVTIWVDTAASFPVFYKRDEDAIYISCTPHSIDPLELVHTGTYTQIFCTEHHTTMLKDWFSIPAGHKIIINKNDLTISEFRYFNHYVSEKVNKDAYFEQQFVNIVHQWANQIIKFADGKPIWVPLSGGYDCRLILSALIMAGAPNLHSYTYGKELSPEIMMAHQVAKELKIDWHFIPYNEQAFQYFFSDTWENYALKNHHFHSLPHEQDFFALLILSQKGILGEQFVAITGHCGEIPAGSVLKSFPINTKDYIAQKYGYQAQYIVEGIDPWDSFHQWLSENRLSKFITNSLRLFEFFGGKWMLPMWHKDFMILFYSLKFEERYAEKAYIEMAFKHFFEPLKIDFWKPKGDTISASKTYKDFIKNILPQNLVEKIQRYNAKNPIADPCNLQTLYEMLFDFMQQNNMPLPKKDGNLNRLHAIYMLEILKSKQKAL
ncbi:MAG: hypothetical protein M9888_10815 [Chitinophagales bacterium]|nr:hypothetical protein [Chitinophagales bacterium]